MRPMLLALCVLLLAGCTSMLLGNGSSAGRPIGTDSRTETTRQDDRQITALVRAHLNRDGELASHAIRIETRRGVVSLRGSVPDFSLRDRASRIAADVNGVQRVDNQLTIER